MAMHDPPQPREFISKVYLFPNGISGRELGARLDVAPSTLNRVLTGAREISRACQSCARLRRDGRNARAPCSERSVRGQVHGWESRSGWGSRHAR